MASTSTNKQPLLVDRPLHAITDLVGSTVEPGVSVDIGGSNSANLLVDCTKNDGAIIDCIYAITRAANPTYPVYFYMSAANDYLRASQSYYVGGFVAENEDGTTIEGQTIYWENMPFVLTPVPHLGSEPEDVSEAVKLRALFIPKGQALWAAVEKQSPSDTATTAPLVGAQGGYY